VRPSRQRAEQEIGALGDAGLRQGGHLVAERAAGVEEAKLLLNRGGKSVPALGAGGVDLRPA
jgi:predicted flavoprotein YhiN